MRKTIFILVLFLTVLGCKKESNIPQSEIRITVANEDISHIEFYRTINGVFMWNDRVDSIFKDDQGDFSYKFTIEKPEYASRKV